MISYEHDPDVVQWGLQLFDAGPYSICGYCGAVTLEHVSCYHGHYFNEDNYETEFRNIENDELMAHALQQQLSQLAVAEASTPPHQWDENIQLSTFSQDWRSHPIHNYDPGQESDQEEGDDEGPSSSCSSSEKNSYCGDEWLYSLEQMDECADGEVGKRLNQMIPIPHVPRTNGEIPSVDEATLDHQRLLDRLQMYELVESKVEGDGNCQFRALSDQIYQTSEHHKFLREQIVNQLKSYPEMYEGYVPMAYGDYIEKMSKNGEWGDHVTLQAAADTYGVKIFVITSFKDTCCIEILPNFERSRRGVGFEMLIAESSCLQVCMLMCELFSPCCQSRKLLPVGLLSNCPPMLESNVHPLRFVHSGENFTDVGGVTGSLSTLLVTNLMRGLF